MEVYVCYMKMYAKNYAFIRWDLEVHSQMRAFRNIKTTKRLDHIVGINSKDLYLIMIKESTKSKNFKTRVVP